MIFPNLRLSIDLAASFEEENCIELRLDDAVQSSDFRANTTLSDTLPALFTRMPMPPSSLSTCKARLQCGTIGHVNPHSKRWNTDCFQSESTRCSFRRFVQHCDAAPAAASPSAMLRPIPPFHQSRSYPTVRSNNAGVFIKRSPSKANDRIDAAK